MESRYKSENQVCEQNPSKINILASPVQFKEVIQKLDAQSKLIN